MKQGASRRLHRVHHCLASRALRFVDPFHLFLHSSLCTRSYCCSHWNWRHTPQPIPKQSGICLASYRPHPGLTGAAYTLED